MANVLVIPDMHAPFQHGKAIPFLLYIKKQFNCDRIICMGDEIDFHALSRFPHDPDGHSAGLELAYAKSFLKEFYFHFPTVSVCTSNHTSRPFRNAYEHGIPAGLIREYKEFLEAPDGWHWEDSIVVDDVLYIHGEGFSGQNAHVRAAQLNRMSTVIGHIHSFGGVQYFQSERNRIFGMNSGSLIDTTAYAFSYGKKLANKPTIGCGVVLNGKHAFFIPLNE